MRALSADERAGLQRSIEQDGVKYPILLDRSGAVIDGHHRRQIAAELGVDCPELVLDVDQEAAERLGISLNLDRRHLSGPERAELVKTLHGAGASTRQIAEQVGVSEPTVRRDLKQVRHDDAPDATDRTIGRDGKSYPRKSTPRKSTPRKETAARREAEEKRRKAEQEERKRIRQRHHGLLTAAAANAPNGKLNLPALRRGRSARTQLLELARLLPPERFVSQLPIEACREFTAEVVSWWLEASKLAAHRLAAEGADLPPLPARVLTADEVVTFER